MAYLDGADVSWPCEEEFGKAQKMRDACSAELQALSDSSRDVVGDIRLCRFLRFHSGDLAKATKAWREFLRWRVEQGIETLRRGVIDLPEDRFFEWLDSVRSPFAPVFALLGETSAGHVIVYAAPGFFKAREFVTQRPACHTLDTDFLLLCVVVEWMLKQLDDRSYKVKQMLYTIKLLDLSNLGTEKMPLNVSEVRSFAKTNIPPIMSMYCEHDILILAINAPFAFRVVLAFGMNLISKRQAKRINVFGSASLPAAQEMLMAIADPSRLPVSVGGTRTEVPYCFPLPHKNPERLAEWMARTEAGLIRGHSPRSTILEQTVECGEVTSSPTAATAAVVDPTSAPETGDPLKTGGTEPALSAAEIVKPDSVTSLNVVQPIVNENSDDERPVAPTTGWFSCCGGGTR